MRTFVETRGLGWEWQLDDDDGTPVAILPPLPTHFTVGPGVRRSFEFLVLLPSFPHIRLSTIHVHWRSSHSHYLPLRRLPSSEVHLHFPYPIPILISSPLEVRWRNLGVGFGFGERVDKRKVGLLSEVRKEAGRQLGELEVLFRT